MRSRLASALPVAVSTAFVVPMTYLVVRALRGDDLARLGPGNPFPFALSRHDALPWILAAAAAGLAAVAGWWRALLRPADLTALEDERRARRAAEEARRHEREWNRRLRAEVARLHRERGPLGHVDDIHELVLRLTMELVEAERGLLLAQGDGGGPLRLKAAAGFEGDPSDSRLVQRFGSDVLRRDATVREHDDHAGELVGIPIYLHDDFHGVVVCANRERGFEHLDDEVLLALGDHAGAILENTRLHGDLRSAYLATIRLLAEALQVKDPEVRTHSESVTAFVAAVADRVGIRPDRREPLVFGSLLHDVGKLGISERILLKPGRLTAEERAIVEQHPRIGYHLVRQVPALAEVAAAILHHHERYDGQGYPARLAGEDIPLEARIVCVADCFTAMTEARPYREPLSWDEACAELERGAGTQFDPEIVRHFVDVVRSHPPEAIEPASIAQGELDVLRDGPGPLGGRSFGVVDSLTLLYSHRRLFESAVAEAHRAEVQGRPFTVVVAELSALDAVNRDEGFAAGDALLQHVARALDEAAVSAGGTAYRAGGRRLAVLAPGGAAEVEPIVRGALDGLDVPGGLALGAATWQPGEDGPAVVARARAALAAQRSGV